MRFACRKLCAVSVLRLLMRQHQSGKNQASISNCSPALERSVFEALGSGSDVGADYPHLALGTARPLDRQKLRIGSRHGGRCRSRFQVPQPWPAAPLPTDPVSRARGDLSPTASNRFWRGQPAASVLSLARLRHAFGAAKVRWLPASSLTWRLLGRGQPRVHGGCGLELPDPFK